MERHGARLKENSEMNCRFCKKKFNPSKAQLMNYDYRCSPCRYKIWQKKLTKQYLSQNPWWKHLQGLRKRCNYPKQDSYSRYGGRGIKALLTVEDIKQLWFRDRAADMEYPSIDRVDSNKNYTYENCRFIEMRENCRRGR